MTGDNVCVREEMMMIRAFCPQMSVDILGTNCDQC